MKNLIYNYKILLLIPLLVIVGCTTSDNINDVITNTTTAQENTVFIETDDAFEMAAISGTFIPQTLMVGINNVLESDVIVSFNVTKNGSTAVEGVDYDISDATIEGSEQFGSGEVTFYAEGTYEVTIASANNPGLVVVENKAIFLVPPPITFTITWDNAFYDYDIYLVTGNQDFGGTVIGASAGITNFESFSAVPPQGFSSFYIQDFWGDNASIPVELSVDIDGDVTIYNVIMDMSKWVLTIETSVDDEGNPVYDITEL